MLVGTSHRNSYEFYNLLNDPDEIHPVPEHKAGGFHDLKQYISNTVQNYNFNAAAGQVTINDQAMENLKNIITNAGLTLDDVASVDVFLTNMAGYADFNEIYQGYFSAHKPARAVVAVKALPKGGCVEVKCVACRKS